MEKTNVIKATNIGIEGFQLIIRVYTDCVRITWRYALLDDNILILLKKLLCIVY